MKAYVQTSAQFVLTGIAFLKDLDSTVTILSGLAALAVAYFAIRSHISKRKLNDIERKIKERELKERYNGNGLE